MSSLVVDASIAVKWFFQEQHSDEALRALEKCSALLAPDLIYSEVGNVIWKRTRAKEITQKEGTEVFSAFGRLPITVFPSFPLSQLALEIAMKSGRTMYDCLYLSLAIREKAPLITADKRFYNALRSSPLSRHVKWIGKFGR